MKRGIGIIGTAVLLFAVSLSSPRYVAQASDVIVDTQPLPEYLTYEDFSLLYSCNQETRIVDPKIIEVSQEDAVRLMKIAQCEAGETDPLAMAYVMKVIINRLQDEVFPNTIEEIINQNNQFSSASTKKYANTEPNVNAHYALYLLESGQISLQAEYFEATWVENSWQSKHKELELGYAGHRFYK